MGNQKVALVTGGLMGIGLAIGRCLKLCGYRVVANYAPFMEVDPVKVKNDEGFDVVCFDVRDYDKVLESISNLKDRVGVIDILINNAGIIRDCFLHKMDVQQWYDVINTNLNGVYHCTSAVIGDMRAQKFGRIINLTSVNAVKGQAGQTNYCAAKAGLIGFTKALAQESARCNITVNCIAPGYTDTSILQSIDQKIMDDYILPSIPMKRLAKVDEIAEMALFLIDKADYITGQVMHVNGGLYM